MKLTSIHTVEFRWVKGHAGHPGNERVDRLAWEAAQKNDLTPDRGYQAKIEEKINSDSSDDA